MFARVAARGTGFFIFSGDADERRARTALPDDSTARSTTTSSSLNRAFSFFSRSRVTSPFSVLSTRSCPVGGGNTRSRVRRHTSSIIKGSVRRNTAPCRNSAGEVFISINAGDPSRANMKSKPNNSNVAPGMARFRRRSAVLSSPFPNPAPRPSVAPSAHAVMRSISGHTSFKKSIRALRRSFVFSARDSSSASASASSAR